MDINDLETKKAKYKLIKFTPEEETIRTYLIKVAKASSLSTYQELCKECKLPYDMGDINDVDKLSDMLTQISKYEFGHDRPMLSVVAINGMTGIPGEGFFKMCEELKYGKWKTLMKSIAFFTERLKDCHGHWQ